MHSATHYALNLKIVVLAGAMLLTPGSVLAQQEVNPDYFDGDTPKSAPARPAAEHRKQAAAVQKQAAAMHKTNADSKHRHKPQANKPNEPQKVAAASHGHV